MVQFVDKLVEKKVQILTNEGRIFVGILKSFDQRMNVILANCEEHIFESDLVPMQRHQLGAFFLRGDNICVIAESLSNTNVEVYGNPIPPMQLHWIMTLN